MSSSFSISIAGLSLREVAASAGPTHTESCAGLLGLFTTSARLSAALREQLTRLQLTEAGFGILTLLHRRGQISSSTVDLASELGLAPRVVSMTLARLEVAQLVHRACSLNPRRKISVSLTASGQKTILDALQGFEQAIHRLMSVLSPQELTTLRQTCSRLDPDHTS